MAAPIITIIYEMYRNERTADDMLKTSTCEQSKQLAVARPAS